MNQTLQNPLAQPSRLQQLFGIDLRSLAVFRISLGVLLLVDVYMRFGVLTAHHTDAGIFPREVLLESSRAAVFSLYIISGSAAYAAFLLAITAACAILLIVGYKTRLITFVCWLLLMSVQRRNSLVINSGDLLFCELFFWSLFLPLGAYASVDSRGDDSNIAPAPRVICSAATVAILLQLTYIYIFSALLKTHPIWRTEGSAVYYALNVDRLVSTFGLMIREHYEAMKYFTYGTFYLELIGPFLAFIPFAIKYFRTFTVLVFISFHLGLAISMHLVLFPYICITAWVLFLPTGFWDWLASLKLFNAAGQAWSTGLKTTVKVIQRFSLGIKSLAPKTQPCNLGFVEQVIVALLAIFVLFLNIGTCYRKYDVPQPIKPLASVLWITQNWAMFAPYPMKDDGWIVAPARLADGNEVDLLTTLPVTFEKPEHLAIAFEAPRWRKFVENIWRGKHRPKIVFYANWLRREWNQSHGKDQQIEAVQIYHVVEYTLPYPYDPYVSPPQLMYQWEGPGTDQWITFKQNELDYTSRMGKEFERRQKEDALQDPDTTSGN